MDGIAALRAKSQDWLADICYGICISEVISTSWRCVVEDGARLERSCSDQTPRDDGLVVIV